MNEQTRDIRKLSQQYAYASLQMHESIAKKLDFSATDHKYLSFFLVKDKLTAGELAALSGLTTGAVTGLIDRFEKKQLVKRQFDSNDRRKVIVVADSQKIIQLFEPFYKAFQEQTEKLIETYSDEEKVILESYLTKSIELMKQTTHNINQ